jgi:LysM repeat protein
MRNLVAPLLVPVVLLLAVACGDDDADAIQTLPPIRTTTTSSTTTTTLSVDPQFYVIQPGETLQIIAERFGVTIDQIVQLNGIENPEYIQAGQQIEIPAGAVIPDSTTTSAPAG